MLKEIFPTYNDIVRYKREMEQIITMQADLDKKLDRQVGQKAGQSYHEF